MAEVACVGRDPEGQHRGGGGRDRGDDSGEKGRPVTENGVKTEVTGEVGVL